MSSDKTMGYLNLWYPKNLQRLLKCDVFLSFSPLASVSGGKQDRRIFSSDMKYVIPTPLERHKLP